MKWILKKLRVPVIGVLVVLGLLDLAGLPVEDYINQLLGLIEGGDEEDTEPATEEATTL